MENVEGLIFLLGEGKGGKGTVQSSVAVRGAGMNLLELVLFLRR